MNRLYDVLDPGFHDDPFPVYARLRDEFPVYHDDERGFWALSRFADVFAAATDVETYSSYAVEAEALLPQLNFLDGARHHDLPRWSPVVSLPVASPNSSLWSRRSLTISSTRSPRGVRGTSLPTSVRPWQAGLWAR